MSDLLEKRNMYELFNVEYSDLILDIYNEINEYSNSPYTNYYNKGNFSKFINLIYRNIDYESSSEILNNIKKNELKEIENEINEENEYFIDNDNLF